MQNIIKKKEMGKSLINIALFGLGRIGQMHAENLLKHQSFNLRYIYDIDKKKIQKLSKIYNCDGIKNPSIAFKDKSIDIILIATSTSTHLRFLTQAVKNKKIVFCEKPLDLNLKKIDKCKKLIQKYNPKIQLGFNRRYDPNHNGLKKFLKKGKIGRLEKIIITSRDPAPPSFEYLKKSGGIFKDMMIHDFDLARFYLDDKDEFNNVFATGSNMQNRTFDRLKDFELATCVLKSKKGVQCIITNSRHCSFGYDQRVELFGNKGMLISGNKKENDIETYNSKSTNNKSLLMNFFVERYWEAYKNQLDDLSKMKNKKFKPLAGFEDGRISILLAEKAIISTKSKKFEKIK